MKAATAIILLVALVGSVICDPDRPDDRQQTAEAEGYGYSGGRSRGSYDDDSHGYKDGYKRRGPMPRVYPDDDDDDDDYLSKQTCLCSTKLSPTTLNGATPGRCVTATSCILTSVGGYCENTQLPIELGCSCATTASFGSSATFGACRGNYATGAGGLCLQFTCPIDGTISIQGQATPFSCAGCVSDFLYIYKNTAFTTNAGDILANNEQSADITVNCKKNDSFYICEKDGIIITSTVKASFFAQSSGACTTLGTGSTWTTLQCRR